MTEGGVPPENRDSEPTPLSRGRVVFASRAALERVGYDRAVELNGGGEVYYLENGVEIPYRPRPEGSGR